MEKIGFIFGGTFLYWSPILLTLGVVAAVIMFLGLSVGFAKRPVGAFLTVPLAVALSIVLARLVHWYCRPDSYVSFQAALTDYSTGGFALAGVFAGCLLAACALRLACVVKELPQALDCMAIAGALGMAVGRLNHFFNPLNRGMVVQSIKTLPLVYPVENAVSGEPEYRLATFMLQAIVAAALFVILLAFYLAGGRKRGGDTCLLFLLVHGASQILLDSTRYDSLFLRSNGFVSLVQILGAVFVVLAVVLFSVRLVRNRGWKWWYLAPWLAIVGMLTAAGIMEYYVQRRSNQADTFYHVMTVCLAGVVLLTCVLCAVGAIPRVRKPEPALAAEE